MYNQIYPYFLKTMFSKFQCAFRKGFNAQHCFSNGRKMVQNPRWKRWTYLWHIFWNTSKYWLRWICRWQYSLHILFKYKNLLDNLQGTFENMFHWFSTNNLVANEGKFHLLTSSKTPVDIQISNTEILNEGRVKLLGVNLEGRLNFDLHLNTLLRKASKKYHALARVCNHMNKKNDVFSWMLS